MSEVANMNCFVDLYRRLKGAWIWIALQFVLTAVLILLSIVWLRVPEKNWWQVAVTLLLPVLLTISFFELEAGTMCALADNDGKRVKLVVGAGMVLAWAVAGWVTWYVLDWCDGQIPQWASYLNSRATAGERARLFTYDHLRHWMTLAEWILRWIVAPGKLIPYMMASAQWGWRLPWRRTMRLLFNWRWWPVVVAAALLCVALPGHYFDIAPHGTVGAQEWHAGLSLTVTYLLGVSCWVLLLAWAAVLSARQSEPGEGALDAELFKRLHMSRKWIGALAGLVVLSVASNALAAMIPGNQPWQAQLSTGLQIALETIFAVLFLVLLAGMLRNMIDEAERRVRFVWGVLAPLISAVVFVAVLVLVGLGKSHVADWITGNFLLPALLIPVAAASTNWGLRLPWRRILAVLRNWRWWLGVLGFGVVVSVLPALLLAVTADNAAGTWSNGLKLCISQLLELACWVLLLSWFAVLFRAPKPPAEEVLVPALVGDGSPKRADAVKLPLPDGGDDSGGKA